MMTACCLALILTVWVWLPLLCALRAYRLQLRGERNATCRLDVDYRGCVDDAAKAEAKGGAEAGDTAPAAPA